MSERAPAPVGRPKSILAVVLHSWSKSSDSMEDVGTALRETFPDDVEVLAPDLPHSHYAGLTRAHDIVRSLLAIIDAADNDDIRQIILVGNSIGAAIVRRTFLVATGRVAYFRPEDALAKEPARSWASKVERIILLAAFNRGWRISDRLSWKYAVSFNTVGFFGHLVPAVTPTIFDFRLGAPFMVQTRLNWLAYRRQQKEQGVPTADGPRPHRPILVQMIGSQDDMIAPVDQVDLAVDGTATATVEAKGSATRAKPNPDDQDYFLFEVPFTNHAQAAVLYGDAKAEARRRLFKAALTGTRAELAETALDPTYLADEIDSVDEAVKNTVFVIHGIRDDGYWTHRIAEHVRMFGGPGGATAFRSWTPTYGYFAMLPFMLPWVRRQKVEWFADQYVTAYAQYPASNFHYVGHSNGTYLAARGLTDYPAMHFQRVLFAGSVVRSDYPWAKRVDEERVTRFHNVVASADAVVAWLPKSVEWLPRLFDLGGAGFDGFDDAGSRPALTELKYVRGGHSAGIGEEHWPQIAAYIAGQDDHGYDKPPPSPGDTLYAEERTLWVDVIARLHIGIPLVIGIILGVAILGYSLGGLFGLLVSVLIIAFVVTRV